MHSKTSHIRWLCFNPLHYGEGFLTTPWSRSARAWTSSFNPLHYGEGFLTSEEVLRRYHEQVSIPCITGRVS